jgi:hypothetical protein
LGLAATIAITGFTSASQAQDATEAAQQSIVTHPAHVHVGTCAELDPNPAYPLNNVGPRTNDDGELPPPEDVRGSLTANPVMVSETEIEVNLDDLLETAHAINIHLSDQDMATYVACGDIGGPVIDDELYIGIMSQNDSGVSGIAKLERDDDKTDVTIYLMSMPVEVIDPATPAS